MKQKLMEWLYRFRIWMQDRNGMDAFSRFLLLGGWAVSMFGSVSHKSIIYFGGEAIMLFAVYRCVSKDLAQRRKELNSYYKYTYKLREKFSGVKSKIKSLKNHEDTKNYIYMDCNQCGTRMRVPKGKGTIIVTCPRCKSKRTIYS